MTGQNINHQGVTVGLAQSQDVDAILELNTLIYGPNDILATRTDFEWRRDKNPYGSAVIPVIRDDQGQVVGFIWLVPLRLRINGQAYRAANGTNLVIHPKNRNGLGLTKLMRRFEQALRDENIAMHFSFISDNNYVQLRNRSPQMTWNIPVLFKVSPLLFSFHGQPNPFGKELTVKTIDQFDNQFDNFWNQVKDKYPVMAIRDRAFLSWRFDQLSGRQYEILIACREDQMLGYMILRCTTIKGIRIGLIMDLVITNEDLGSTAGTCLMNEAQTYFRKQHIQLSMALMVAATDEYRILRRAGYVRLPDVLAPRVFHFAYFLHDEMKENLTPSAQDWFVTFADYESY